MLRLGDRAFLFWGADEAGDIFTGYTFTLESGFPEEAISIVLRSIVNSDKFIGEMKPILDERLLWFAFYKTDPVAFFISLPEINQIFKYVNGRLDWVGKLKFLWHKLNKTNKKADQYIGRV